MLIILFGSTGMLGNYVYSYLQYILSDKLKKPIEFTPLNIYNGVSEDESIQISINQLNNDICKENKTENLLQNNDKKKIKIICINRCDFDIENDEWDKLKNILQNLNEDDVIINCSGIIPQKSNETEYKKFIKVNTLFPHKLNEYSKMFKLKFIHITTDCVFDGSEGNYTEYNEHTAKTIYGISKSLGEPKEATIIRTSIIGHESYGKKSLLEWIFKNKDKTINGYTNHYWNGITCLTLSKIIHFIIKNNEYWSGIKHIFSPNALSKYDICKYVNDLYNLNMTIVPFTDSCEKKMTLTGYNFFKIDTIFEQIKEQKKFSSIYLLNDIIKHRYCEIDMK